METQDKPADLPEPMQGAWIDADDPSVQLVISGSKVTCFSKVVAYDFLEVEEEEGAITVTLCIEDESREDTFQRENITGLVLTPEGELHAYNVKFAMQMVRKQKQRLCLNSDFLIQPYPLLQNSLLIISWFKSCSDMRLNFFSF